MIKLNIDHNLVRLQQNFIKFSDMIKDMSPAFKLFIPEFQKSRVGWIYAGRDVDGKRFTPLSKKYAVRKKMLYGSQPILIASGKLINAVRGNEGWKQKITKDSLSMEIDLPYASYHQDGTNRMPQRAYFLTKQGTLNKMDYAQLLQAMEGQIEDASKAMLNESLLQLAGINK
jgi:hypothetical protein